MKKNWPHRPKRRCGFSTVERGCGRLGNCYRGRVQKDKVPSISVLLDRFYYWQNGCICLMENLESGENSTTKITKLLINNDLFQVNLFDGCLMEH